MPVFKWCNSDQGHMQPYLTLTSCTLLTNIRVRVQHGLSQERWPSSLRGHVCASCFYIAWSVPSSYSGGRVCSLLPGSSCQRTQPLRSGSIRPGESLVCGPSFCTGRKVWPEGRIKFHILECKGASSLPGILPVLNLILWAFEKFRSVISGVSVALFSASTLETGRAVYT